MASGTVQALSNVMMVGDNVNGTYTVELPATNYPALIIVCRQSANTVGMYAVDGWGKEMALIADSNVTISKSGTTLSITYTASYVTVFVLYPRTFY